MAIITGRVNLKGRELENLIRCYRGGDIGDMHSVFEVNGDEAIISKLREV